MNNIIKSGVQVSIRWSAHLKEKKKFFNEKRSDFKSEEIYCKNKEKKRSRLNNLLLNKKL